jgi:hypothetical protein
MVSFPDDPKYITDCSRVDSQVNFGSANESISLLNIKVDRFTDSTGTAFTGYNTVLLIRYCIHSTNTSGDTDDMYICNCFREWASENKPIRIFIKGNSGSPVDCYLYETMIRYL